MNIFDFSFPRREEAKSGKSFDLFSLSQRRRISVLQNALLKKRPQQGKTVQKQFLYYKNALLKTASSARKNCKKKEFLYCITNS
jgi:hypothetical protein